MILSPTFWPSLLAVIGYAVAIAWPQRAEQTGHRVPTVLAAFCLLAWVAQAVAIGVDVLALDAPQAGARFGFAPALSVTSWLTPAERRLRSGSAGSGQIPSPNRPAGQALGMPLLRLESLTLKFVAAGFAMLSLTLLLGAAFTSPWKWDHKTIFSILSWLVFATLLIGRARFGWRGRQAIRWLIAGSLLLLLAYVGSRFVLEILLHRPA